jgi:Protein of unknown function (DUF3618)
MTNEPSGRQKVPAGEQPSDPAALREDIEQTRQEVGDTVEALAAKADVRGRVRRKAADTTEQAKQKVAEAAGAARTKAQDLKEQAVARTAAVRETVAETPPQQVVGQAAGTARSWRGPLLLAGGTVAVLAGWLRRRSRSRARRRR